MFWRGFLQQICTACEFEPPAPEAALAEVEMALAIRVPDELRDLWQEANGVQDKYGPMIWSTQAVIEENLELRAYPDQNDLYMTFESMLCFMPDGGGDLFFFPIQGDGKVNRPDIFVWKHETDSREWVASNLQSFLEKRLSLG